MNEEAFNQSKASGPHSVLNQMAGEWEGVTRVWFKPDVVEDESPCYGLIRPTLDGRFMLHEYASQFKGRILNGIAIIGYHQDWNKFEMAWADSFHMGTGIMYSEWEANGDGEISVLGSYGVPGHEERWGWRTNFKMNGSDELIITAYNISPEGEEAKAVETVYQRK